MKEQMKENTQTSNIDIDSITKGLKLAREGNYDLLRQYFNTDYKSTCFNIAKIGACSPEFFNIEKEVESGGLLENITNNAISGIQNEKQIKEHLVNMLSWVRPKGIIGNIEYATYMIPFYLTKLILLPDSLSFKLCEKITYKIFIKKREKSYKKILNLN